MCVNGVASASVFVKLDAPQGSVLESILFNLYASPIHSISKKHGETNQYHANDDLYLWNQICDTKSWIANNFLQLNKSMTTALLVNCKSSSRKPLVQYAAAQVVTGAIGEIV